ncbi:MAG: hypothetical protein ACLRWF_09605 [Ruthenibacterium sp.]
MLDGATLTAQGDLTGVTFSDGAKLVVPRARRPPSAAKSMRPARVAGRRTARSKPETKPEEKPATPSAPAPAPEKANPKTGVAF